MVRSTKLAHDGQRYHVHQELITEQQVGEDDHSTLIMEGYICKKCENDLRQSKIPMYSVAKLDFGLISRVIQDELTPIEKLLIARHRPLAVTLKLSRGGTGPDGLIGHSITFAHRGPESLIPVLPTIDDDIRNLIHVTFVGHRGMPENVATFLLHVPAANVRPHFVINYLRILKDIHPCYADLQINDSNEVHQAMAALP